MELENHIFASIDAYERGEVDHALHHACIAIEGSARNAYGKDKISRKEYKDFIRSYYWIIEPMIGVGINLEETRFSGAKITDDKDKLIPDPDLADVIYDVFRCYHAHSKPVPKNYQLLPVTDGRSVWIIADGILQMPERVIWALIAVCLFSKGNANIQTSGDYYLEWGSNNLGLGMEIFPLKDWWGKEDEFRKFMDNQDIIRVTLNGLNF